MKLKKLMEEFATGRKDPHGNYREIFINPSKKEMDEVSSQETTSVRYKSKNPMLRFLVYKGKVYVFSINLLHKLAKDALKLSYEEKDAFEGAAEKIGSGWRVVESHTIDRFNRRISYGVIGSIKRLKEYLTKDWKFINKYIDVRFYLQNIVKDLVDRKVKGFKTLIIK